MILFGTNPIAWANDDDRSIGANIATTRILDEAGRQIGFDGIENGHRWPDDPEELRALLGSYGLKFISGWYSTELLVRSVEDEIKACQHHLAKLKHNGCAVMIVCETSNAIHGDAGKPVNDRPRLTPAEMAVFGAKLEAFAAYLAGEGITLVYHHHMGTIVESPADIDAFMTRRCIRDRAQHRDIGRAAVHLPVAHDIRCKLRHAGLIPLLSGSVERAASKSQLA